MYQLKLNINSFSGSTAIIPISLDSKPVDNTDIINRVFVDKAVEDSINDIIDYEKCKYTPLTSNNEIANTVTYNLFDKNGQKITYSALGFTHEDILYKRLNFTESRLRISYYNNPNPLTNRLLDVSTINCRTYSDDLVVQSETISIGTPKQPNMIDVRFVLSNPFIDKFGFSENFYIYNRKDLQIGEEKSIYVKFEFLNAKTGKIIRFMSSNLILQINELINNLYFEYKLKRENNGYYYNIVNSTYSSKNITINLYEINTV